VPVRSAAVEDRSEALLEVCVGGVGGEARLVRLARLGVPPQREEREADPRVRARPARPSGERGTPVGERIAVPVEVRAAGGAIGEQSAYGARPELGARKAGGAVRRRGGPPRSSATSASEAISGAESSSMHFEYFSSAFG